MSTVLREPDHSYEDLVGLVTELYGDAEELPALSAAVARPGERLWLAEPYALVYRLWRKRRGRRSYWAVDEEFALDAADRISKDVAETVLARLHRAGQSREYVLVPGSEESDLAAAEELDRIWLAGSRAASRVLVEGYSAHGAALVDILIQGRMAKVKAELARLKALRARNLQDAYGTGEEAVAQTAAALGCDPAAAREILAARERYRQWIRSGAAHARDTIPVHRPAGPTGLAEQHAARLMTAACRREIVVPDRAYPRPLPPDLAPWYVYIKDRGHCIAVAVDGEYRPDGDPWKYMAIAPVRLILEVGWTVQDLIVVSPVPYDTGIGTVPFNNADNEF